jgi:hypothetical protein
MAHGQGLCCHRKLLCVGQVCPRQQRKVPGRTDKLAANNLAYVRLASTPARKLAKKVSTALSQDAEVR